MNFNDVMAQHIADLFGLIYRNLIRDENDSISMNQDSQTALLSVLLRNGPTKMSEIGKLLNVTKPNVTFLVDKMEEQGLIKREKVADDRRVSNICLTELGRTAVEEKRNSLYHKIASRLTRLSAEDTEDLRQAVETTSGILRKLYNVNLQNNGEEKEQ
ncbi:MAG TPA: MarR family transcriptional regulator [Clostridia bacterium]|nr:MarR family transcriptional regulator [Clostridia bacterium]